ncbi:hypothetical protein FOL47_003167 [Perkinsus chesapeaki]|uniref:GPI mannosyltransferase I n=1 Tax=Perkinsus chesapeaki TaxID=330153 RepID=A0A7J6M956_PERCH|nr:hypothetical protein FOL47_003167 [Perkinsus chesapeaki]
MPTNAQGWVKPELRVSVMRVKHLKDTGCHAVEVELDGQKPKRTAWVGALVTYIARIARRSVFAVYLKISPCGLCKVSLVILDGGNDKEFNREAGFFLKGDQQANNADFWNKAFVHITVILERTFRSDKNAAACHLSMKVIRKYGEVRGWVTLLHDGKYAGEMLLRAKLQGVDNWKDKQKGPASEAAVNLPFNGAPDSNTANWESYNAMMVAAAPMGAPGVFGAMQMQKDAKDGTVPSRAEGTPVPMSQEEYHTQIAMLRDIEARHAKDVQSQREQWVKQEEEARNRAIQQRQEQGDDGESSSDEEEEPEEDAADKRKGYPAHMKLDDDNDDSDSDDEYDDARPSNQVDAMTDNCEGLMTMLHWDSDRPGDRGGIVVPPRGQVAASRAGPVIPQQQPRPVDGGWGAAMKNSNVWNTGDFASLDIAAAQVQSSQGNPFQHQQQQRPITPPPPQRVAASGGYRNVTPPPAPRQQQQHPPVGRPLHYQQQQQQPRPSTQQQTRIASPPAPPAVAQQQQARQPYYVYQGPPPNSVPASALPRSAQTSQPAPQRYASPPPQAAQPQGYPQYSRQAPQAAAPQRPGTPPPQYQRPPQMMPSPQYTSGTPSRAQPMPYAPPSNSVPLGRLGDYSSAAAAPRMPSPPPPAASNMVYNNRGAMPAAAAPAGQYAPAPQVQAHRPGVTVVNMLNEALSDFRFVAVLSAAIHVCLILYGHWQDTHLRVKYTDVDYWVYTDAARAVYNGGSPFERHTYRYTPLLAWLLVPNISLHITFGKVLFSLCDMAIGLMLYRMLKDSGKTPGMASKLSAVWLLSPITLNVSTRGNADSLICLMVVATLYHIQRGEWIRSALWFGLSVHMKIFPVIYAIPLVMYLNPDFLDFKRVGFWNALKLNSKQIWYTVISAGLFFVLLGVLYYIYGWEFLFETYLYHFVRRDHRHNFSIFFYLMYLSAETPSMALSIVTFIPQWVVVLAVGCYFSRISLNMGSFLQTVLFVAYNKVCTAQYFVWYLALLPLALGQLKPTVNKTWLLILGVMWLATEGLWLFFAYQLEFEGKNTFMELFGASALFFMSQLAIVCTFIANFDWRAAAKSPQKEVVTKKPRKEVATKEPRKAAVSAGAKAKKVGAVRGPADRAASKTLVPGQLLSFETAVPGDVITYIIDAEGLKPSAGYEIRTSMPGQAPMSTLFILSADNNADNAIKAGDFKIMFRTDDNGTIVGAGMPDSTLRRYILQLQTRPKSASYIPGKIQEPVAFNIIMEPLLFGLLPESQLRLVPALGAAVIAAIAMWWFMFIQQRPRWLFAPSRQSYMAFRASPAEPIRSNVDKMLTSNLRPTLPLFLRAARTLAQAARAASTSKLLVCACATCHMILPEDVFSKLPEPDEEELDMLDLAVDVSDTSRLGCQVTVVPEMDNMVIRLPSEAVNQMTRFSLTLPLKASLLRIDSLMTLSFDIRAVEGLVGRTNYVYHRKGSGHNIQVWFLGDISTFAGGFRSRPTGDVRSDYRYSIDGVAWVISSLVPQDVDLILIRPHLLTDSVYAIYSNFTLVDAHGCPRWKDMRENPDIAPDGTAHLERLLQNVMEGELDASSTEVSLYGFSKGCIVLSSLMKSGFADLPLRKLTFIDPGLNQPDELFPVSPEEVKAIDKKVEIEVHSTPRQTADAERPWIKLEIDEFVRKCVACGLQAHHIEHFKNVPILGPTNALDMHFDAIPAALGSSKARGYFGRWAAGLSFDTVRPPVREPHFFR